MVSEKFHCHSIIDKSNYLKKGTKSDISYITHQCAKFYENPKESHTKARKWLVLYLKGTKDKGLVLNCMKEKGINL